MTLPANERTAGNRAAPLRFHARRPGRAVPECERWTEYAS